MAQLSLLGRDEPRFDEDFSRLERVTLSDGAWLDLQPGWLRGHERVFEALERTTRWRTEERQMYERVVDVPRMFAVLPDDGPGHPILLAIRRALSAHYATEFVRTSLALYRDGRDSVALHGDYVARRMQEALVATVSVGAPRRFLVKSAEGGSSLALSLGWGDLLVMGGSAQRTHRHGVPKVAHADPRIAIMFRPEWPAP